MITEDYCSYETSKLLAEKGFDELSTIFYNEDGTDLIELYDYEPLRNSEISGYARVTQSLALKWLREVQNIHIEIYRTACGYLYIISNIPYGTDLYNPEYGGDDENSGQWTTYERAVEAAILYVLKNLI